MKRISKGLMLLLVLTTCLWLRADVTIGVADTGSCYPFMCNDSGTNSGISIWYEQVYSSAAFSGAVTIGSATFYWQFAQQFGGSDTLLGGGYEFDLSTTSAPVNGLNGSCLSCNLGADNKIVGDFVIPAGGIPFGTSYTFKFVNSFKYDPSKGNLLLSIAVNNQDNVPNGSDNSYNDADDTGTTTSRAYSFLNSNSGTADSVGLVTTFGIITPEPPSLLLIGSAIVTVAITLRGKLRRR